MDKEKNISISFELFTSIIMIAIIVSFFIGMVAEYYFEKNHSKFCPICGDRYGIDCEYCEHDGNKLQSVRKSKEITKNEKES